MVGNGNHLCNELSRAERVWLAIAVAILWMLFLGGSV
jgi:hypothetical protein